MNLHEDGSATVEGPTGVRAGNGCVYEGDHLAGSVELEAPLRVVLGGTFALVAEEEPGVECSATESVSVDVLAERFYPSVELVG